eukprot:9122751-Alexandrium_andersonii.AAC.1
MFLGIFTVEDSWKPVRHDDTLDKQNRTLEAWTQYQHFKNNEVNASASASSGAASSGSAESAEDTFKRETVCNHSVAFPTNDSNSMF